MTGLRDGNYNPATTAAMLDGIVDEIGGGLEQKVSIARDEYVLIADEAQTRTGFLRRRIEQFDDLTRNLGQVHGAEGSAPVARFDLRNPRERREHPQHAVEVGHGFVDQRLIVLHRAFELVGKRALRVHILLRNAA